MSTVGQISLSDKYQTSESVVYRIIAGQAVLVPIRKNVGELDNIFTLNETGVAIWNQLDGQTTLQQVLEFILNEYEITDLEASQDLLQLVARLAEIGAINKV
jgi:hypothetical protein